MTDRSELEHGRMSFQLAYGDCDVVGIAYFAIYYPWMERIYSTWMHAHGIRSGETVDDFGVVIVGVNSNVDYLTTVTVFDELDIQMVASRVGASSYTIGFEFTRGGEPVTRGSMTFAVREAKDFSKAAIPERLRTVLETLPEPSFPAR